MGVPRVPPTSDWAWNAFIAAVCGNISIWKSSPKTPLSAITLTRCL
jgi:aldehyde dehydrogenase (NAD+)